MSTKIVTLILGVLLMGINLSFAGDIEAGKGLSAKCVGCHGVNGISANPMMPSLAGKDIAYLKEKMVGYRDGSLVNPIMNGMAGGLSDSDIELLASYYNSLSGG